MMNIKEDLTYSINEDNETLIVSNIIQNKENRETFIRKCDYLKFRRKEFQTISWAVVKVESEKREVNTDAILLDSKLCPIKFLISYDLLNKITTNFPVVPAENFLSHLDTLINDYVKSTVLDKVFTSLYPVCSNPATKSSDITERLKYLLNITEKGNLAAKLEFKGMDTLVPQWEDHKLNKKSFYTCGFSQLDALFTEGFAPGQITSVAALSASGKSSLCLSMMKNLANNNIPTAQFALEMPNMSLISKLMAFNTRLSLNKIVRNPDELDTPERTYYDNELRRLALNKFIFLNDKPSQSIPSIREQTMLLQDTIGSVNKSFNGYMVVVIDLFGKISEFQGSDNFARDYEKQLNLVQAMTRELGVHLILVAQIVRSVANRKNKRPSMNDLKNSGALTEASDIVLGIHRPFYDPDVALRSKVIENINRQSDLFNSEESERKDSPLDGMFEASESSEKNIAEVIILKQRMGENNVIINFIFDPETTCFYQIEENYQNTLNKSKFDLNSEVE